MGATGEGERPVWAVRPRVRAIAGVGLALALVLPTGCRRFRRAPAPPPGKPPIEAFAGRSVKGSDGATVAIPEALLQPWRVMGYQEWPRPKKNPRWQPVAADASAEVVMPEGSRFRCVLNPVKVTPVEDDEAGPGVRGFRVLRGVRCSSDGFRTYAQGLHAATYDLAAEPLGSTGEQGELSLHDVIGGRPVDITVILRRGAGPAPARRAPAAASAAPSGAAVPGAPPAGSAVPR